MYCKNCADYSKLLNASLNKETHLHQKISKQREKNQAIAKNRDRLIQQLKISAGIAKTHPEFDWVARIESIIKEAEGK